MNRPSLNTEQQQAVDHLDGPALVVAGAGTGKTRVIVERILTLLENGVKPESIVALTFTEKAAQEMQDRVNELRGGFHFDVQIATFNGFGEQLVRRFAPELGIHSSARVLNDVGQTLFLKEQFKELKLDYYAPITKPDGMLGELAKYYSKLKQLVITPETYTEFANALPAQTTADKLEKKRHKELAYSYQRYTELSRAANLIDYDDQIYLLVNLLKSHPNIQAQLHQEFAYILVDEFQDTNPMQSELLRLIINKKNNIMAVGDDDQSIYGFRGATIENILSFRDTYPKTKQIVLSQNYRSTQEILDTSYQLITNNNPERLEVKNGIHKQLTAQSSGEQPIHTKFESHEEEIRTVSESIAKLIKNGVNPGDIAVLVRRNKTALSIHDVLTAMDIPHQLAGQTHDLYKESIIQTLLDALRIIHDPLDNQSAYYTLRGPLFNIVDAELATLASRSRREHTQLLEEAASGSEPMQQAHEHIIKWRAQAERLSIGQLVYSILTDSGLKDTLVANAQDSVESAQQMLYVSQFFQQLKQYERASTRQNLHAFIDDIPLLALAGENSSDDLSDGLDSTSVSVLTIHKSKGLEWDHVFILDINEGTLPSSNRRSSLEIPEALLPHPSDPDNHIREERRLFYVALTRAKKTVAVSYAQDHGGKRAKKPSRFIEECFTDAATTHTPQSPQLHFDLFSEQNQAAKQSLPSDMLRDNTLILSVSQLNDYFRCPYDFYYRHILRVPQDLSAGLQYGSIMHAMIERFTRLRQAGGTIDVEHMIKDMKASWPQAGFISKTERERAREQAVASFKTFANRELANTRIPTSIEKPFQIHVGDVRISGRFDAVYEEGGNVEIRDYKSGSSVTDEAKAKRRAQSSDQLTQYALAWQQLNNELPQVVSLDFFETGYIGAVKKTQRSIDTMTKKITEAEKNIRSFTFTPGSDHTFCQHQ